MRARDTRTAAAIDGPRAIALVASGAAGGYLLAFFAPPRTEGMSFVAGGLAAFAVLVASAAFCFFRRSANHPDIAPGGQTRAQVRPQASASAPHCRPDDISVSIDGSTIDDAALESLQKLGGDAFVSEVVSQFISEGVLTLLKIAQAVGEANVADYCAQVHALRSSAANVGARRLYKLSLGWRDLTAEELAASGAARFVLLRKEFIAAEAMLKSRAASPEKVVASDAKAG